MTFRHRLLLSASLVLLFTVAVVSVGILQLSKQRNAYNRMLAARARQAEASGNWDVAELLLRELQERGSTEEGLFRRIGLAIDRGARSSDDRSRCLPYYRQHLLRRPNDAATRIRCAELRCHDYPVESLREVQQAIKSNLPSPDARRVRALCLMRLGGRASSADDLLREAYKATREAVQAQPDNRELVTTTVSFLTENTQRLAEVLAISEGGVIAESERILDQFVASSEDEAAARRVRLELRIEHAASLSDDPYIVEDAERLAELDPSDTAIQFLAAGTAIHRSLPGAAAENRSPTDATKGSVAGAAESRLRLEQAASHLTALTKHADLGLGYLALAQLQWFSGAAEKAADTLQAGVRGQGDNSILRLRQAEMQLALGQLDKARETLNRLRERLRIAQPLLLELRPLVDLLESQWHLHPNNPAGRLDTARNMLLPYATSGATAEVRSIAEQLLGSAAAAAGDWYRAAALYQSASRKVPRQITPRLGTGLAFFQLGKHSEAARVFQSVLESPKLQNRLPHAVGLKGALARARLQEQLALPTSKRNWQAFDTALESLRQAGGDSPLATVLAIEARWARSTPDTVDRFEPTLSARPASCPLDLDPKYWQLLAEACLRHGHWELADSAIGRLTRLPGASDYLPELQCERAMARGDLEAADHFLQELARIRPARQQSAILRRRANVAVAKGEVERARRLLEDWVERHPHDRPTRFHLSQIAWSLGDANHLREFGRELRNWEGEETPESTVCLLQARLLDAISASQSCDTLLTEANTAINKFRGDPRLYLIATLIAERAERRALAEGWLTQAINLGAVEEDHLLRLASLHSSAGRIREALELSLRAARPSKIKSAIVVCQVMRRGSDVPTQLASETESCLDRALATSRSRPGNLTPLFLLELALLRESQGQSTEAIALTREALMLRPQAVDLKNNLAWLLAAYTTELDEAEQLVKAAISEAGIRLPLLDTQGVVLLAKKQFGAAERVLRLACENEPVPRVRLLHYAEALAGLNDFSKARDTLDQIDALPPQQLSLRDRRALHSLRTQLMGAVP